MQFHEETGGGRAACVDALFTRVNRESRSAPPEDRARLAEEPFPLCEESDLQALKRWVEKERKRLATYLHNQLAVLRDQREMLVEQRARMDEELARRQHKLQEQMALLRSRAGTLRQRERQLARQAEELANQQQDREEREQVADLVRQENEQLQAQIVARRKELAGLMQSILGSREELARLKESVEHTRQMQEEQVASWRTRKEQMERRQQAIDLANEQLESRQRELEELECRVYRELAQEQQAASRNCQEARRKAEEHIVHTARLCDEAAQLEEWVDAVCDSPTLLDPAVHGPREQLVQLAQQWALLEQRKAALAATEEDLRRREARLEERESQYQQERTRRDHHLTHDSWDLKAIGAQLHYQVQRLKKVNDSGRSHGDEERYQRLLEGPSGGIPH